jgi:acyl-CoA thioester hydrolase
MATTAFQYRHRVTYAECTAGNHIYYSRYLDILEAARGEFFRQLGAPLLQWQLAGIIFPVIECRIRYKIPARYDDLLTCELWPAAIERVRLNFNCRIHHQAGALILEAETFHACTGLDEKPRRIPEALDQLLRPHLRTADSTPRQPIDPHPGRKAATDLLG